jgi:hypothetical protein
VTDSTASRSRAPIRTPEDLKEGSSVNMRAPLAVVILAIAVAVGSGGRMWI